nr:sigma 54-interacting transcriptional regulator [uncultured Desulfuromonas sp.]
MEINHEQFFREMTLRVCSSLDIRLALKRTYDYLRQIMPLHSIYLNVHDETLSALRFIAWEPEECKIGEIIPLPKDAWEWSRALREPVINDANSDDPMINKMAELTHNEGFTTMPVPLYLEGKRIGGLILRAVGIGAYDHTHIELMKSLTEPFAIALANALAHQELLSYRDQLLDDNRFLQNELIPPAATEIIGSNGGLRNVMEMVGQVAPRNNTVLLLGETGVGKEVIANAIHYSSTRRDGPFIKVNCGAIPESLIDSELFGHEKGAFTGAVTTRRGRFERSSGGTIFLDEIGELPLAAQVKLLRILQSHELERVGGSTPIPVDIRVIAATHRNLEEMVAAQQFREDLWFRLNVFPIFIPPLRQRREDIPALVRSLLTSKSREMGLHPIPPLAVGALERLTRYAWPGNVRELQNVIERELVRYKGGALTFDRVVGQDDSSPVLPVDAEESFSPKPLDDHLTTYLRQVLEHTSGRINGEGGAAQLLGINPSTLRSKMKKLGIVRR